MVSQNIEHFPFYDLSRKGVDKSINNIFYWLNQ